MAYTDSNAIGEITEVTGEAIVIRTDGTEEVVTLGTEIFLGDIIETTGDGAVNIGFTDESSFAVSDNARVAIDEYVYDPATESGDQDFTVMKGVFMYTSGLIGRENPDSVEIDTPVGSIGIRGTIIGGKIAENGQGDSQISVIEGAIVVRNEAGEQLLTNMFDTVKLSSIDVAPSDVQTLDVSTVANDYSAVKGVSASLFSSFDDQMRDEGVSEGLDESSVEEMPAEDMEAQDDVSSDSVEVEAPTALDAKTEVLEKSLEAKELKAEKAADKDAARTDNMVDRAANRQNDDVLARRENQDNNQQDNPIDNQDDTAGQEPETPVDVVDSSMLSLGVNSLNMFSGVDGIEGAVRVGSDDFEMSSGFMGSRIVQLEVSGELASNVNIDSFNISGPYQDHLRVINEGGDFFLALEENISLVEVGNSDGFRIFEHSTTGNGESIGGGPIDLGTLWDLGNVSVSLEGYRSEALNIDSVVLESATNMYQGEHPELITGVGDANDNIRINDNFNFKLIDTQGGIDRLYLDDGDILERTGFNFASSESNINGFSKDLSSVEHIFFNNAQDTLVLDLENVLRLLETSDLTPGGQYREFVIHQNNSNFITDALTGSEYNGVTFGDDNGNEVHLDESNGFQHLGAGEFGSSDDLTTYEMYRHDLGIVRIESQIAGAETGGL